MKKRIVLIAFLALGIAAPAFSAQISVEEFLSRYRPTPVAVASPVQDPLAGMINSGVLPLSVNDVIALTLQNNLDISVNRMLPLSSQLLIESLYRPFEPSIRISSSLSRDTSPSSSTLIGAASLLQTNMNWSVGIGQTLQTGTNFAVDLTLSRRSSNSTFNTINPAWTGAIRYSVSQPLLRNFGRAINTRQIRVAQTNQEISETQFERQVIDITVQALKVYWDLVFSAEDLKVKQNSLDLAMKTLADNRIQVEIGTLAPIDLVQAESEVVGRREQLLISTSTQTQVEDQIKRLVTDHVDPGLALATISPVQAVSRPSTGDILPVEEAIRVAWENRLELYQYELELRNREIDVNYAKNQLLPSVDLTASFVQNGVGGTRLGATPSDPPLQTGGVGSAFSQLFGYDYTGYTVGVSVQIPLRNRAQEAEYSRAMTERELTERRMATAASQIALEVRNAITQVELQRARIEAAEAARDFAARRLDAEERKFDLGASTIRFVLEEQRNLTQAQTNEIAALVNYAKALVDYDRALGLVLTKNNIEIDRNQNALLIR